MVFKRLDGFNARGCGTRLYNAGLFNFDYPPRDLSVVHTNWVIVMSRVNPGPLNPKERDAFGAVIEATAEKLGDVLVRDTPGDLWGQGTVLPVTQPPPPAQNAPGIAKFISGANALDCAATLKDSYLIAQMNQDESGYVQIRSRSELDTGNAEQTRDFDFVVKAVAEKFGNVQVSDVPPDLL